MKNVEDKIANGARAVIIRDDKVLLIYKQSSSYGERYTLPGGSQEPGESLKEALMRECMEEIGIKPRLLGLAHVADWYKKRSPASAPRRHCVEFFFTCSVPKKYKASNGPQPDKNQVDVRWVALQDLGKLTLHPTSLAKILPKISAANEPVYLGTLR